MTEWQARHYQFDVGIDTDQAEWAAIRFDTSNVDEGIRDEQLGGEFSSTEDREDRASALIDEVKRRREILGRDYPFEIDRNALRYSPSKSRVYEFCLSINFVSSLSSVDGKQYQIAFERLVRDVVACFLGPRDVFSFRTGMPGDDLEDRPVLIKDIVEIIAQNCGPDEWKWSPETGYPEQPNYRDLGDLGMDVVAWKTIPDGRGGHLFLLAQCACGITDWNGKFDEPSKGRLSSWMKISDVPFVKLFAVPFHIPNQPYFGEVTRAVEGLTFDRARIVAIAEGSGNQTYIRKHAPASYSTLLKDAIKSSTGLRARPRRRKRAGAVQRSR